MVLPLWRGRGERPGLGRCTNPEHFQGVATVKGSVTHGACRDATGIRAVGCGSEDADRARRRSGERLRRLDMIATGQNGPDVRSRVDRASLDGDAG